MKKLMALASMMIVLSVSAQQRPQGSNQQQQNNRVERKQTNSVDQQLKKFEKYNLTTTQKRKVKSLLESNLSTSNFNKKLEKILSTKQYAQYVKDQKGTTNKKSVKQQQSKTIDYRQAQKSK